MEILKKNIVCRLSQTLMHVKNFHWVVIEDSTEKTKLVANLLKESNLKYTHLNIKTHRTKHSTVCMDLYFNKADINKILLQLQEAT